MDFTDRDSIQGERYLYSLIEKMGEGDAGEVFLVENLSLSRSEILKRPRRSAFPNEFRRQAEQIRLEGRILTLLESHFSTHTTIKTPQLIDTARAGTEFSERYFITLSQAPGRDFASLARAARLGGDPDASPASDHDALPFLEAIIRSGEVPERLLLEALNAQLELFSVIHHAPIQNGQMEGSGILWNDVKPDHIFWDFNTHQITFIDWGNARLLGQPNPPPGALLSPIDDLRQFWEEMGKFIAPSNPGLLRDLDWPEVFPDLLSAEATFQLLHERVRSRLRSLREEIRQVRQDEAKILEPSLNPEPIMEKLSEIQTRLISFAELPDHTSAIRMATATISNLAAAADLAGVVRLAHWAANLPGVAVARWQLLANLAGMALAAPPASQAPLLEAVRCASNEDWEGCLWYLVDSLQAGPEPDRWNDIFTPVRELAAGQVVSEHRPLMVLRRAVLTLQSALRALEDKPHPTESTNASQTADIQAAIETLRAFAQNWIQLDPLPPHSGLAYLELQEIQPLLEDQLPEAAQALTQAISPAALLVDEVLSNWEKKEFDSASRNLRALLPWDPDRRRLIRTHIAFASAADWLHRLKTSPNPDTDFLSQITDFELEGRELRSQVGSAGWIDRLLEGLKAIRLGKWPGELLVEQPELLADMPWLALFVRSSQLQRIFHPQVPAAPLKRINGWHEGQFGPGEEIAFLEPADAWIPEARGSSARVFFCTYTTDEPHAAVLKIMRMDQTSYALPLFREEQRILQIMDSIDGVNPLLESGFLWMGEGSLPADADLAAIRSLRGLAVRIGVDQGEKFLDELEDRIKDGWTPYLILKTQPKDENLLLKCDVSLNQGNLPHLSELLRLSVQICEVLEEAHKRNIVYRDHKILHYYWNAVQRELTLIDWNVAVHHPEGLDPQEIHMDLVQLGARGLHHILTGRTAPGALPLGPTRPEEIDQSAESYQTQWTYDDRRLNQEIRTILEQLLAGSYQNATDLKRDLKRACLNLG